MANQLSRRVRSTNDKRNRTKRGFHGSAFELLNAMKSATASDGTLTIASLDSTLLGMEISEPTAEHLIGQAEMEGVLLRLGADTWFWLQQSS
jgi:BioD-like phosphotransacetylase family protein